MESDRDRAIVTDGADGQAAALLPPAQRAVRSARASPVSDLTVESVPEYAEVSAPRLLRSRSASRPRMIATTGSWVDGGSMTGDWVDSGLITIGRTLSMSMAEFVPPERTHSMSEFTGLASPAGRTSMDFQSPQAEWSVLSPLPLRRTPSDGSAVLRRTSSGSISSSLQSLGGRIIPIGPSSPASAPDGGRDLPRGSSSTTPLRTTVGGDVSGDSYSSHTREVPDSYSHEVPGVHIPPRKAVVRARRHPCIDLFGFGMIVIAVVNFIAMNASLPNPLQSPVFKPSPRIVDVDLDPEPMGELSTVAPMYQRLLGLAAHAQADAESQSWPEVKGIWNEWLNGTEFWIPCADRQMKDPQWSIAKKDSNGYILVKAGGSFNQQRVAVCNAVAVARMLNATLVIPELIYEGSWKDDRQLREVFDLENFIHTLQDDVPIVETLPPSLQSLDLKIMKSIFTDKAIRKEAPPRTYLQNVLPVLLKNSVVLFSPFINRLSYNHIPVDVQRLRCKCNFHALKFLGPIQEVGDLIIERLRSRDVLSVPVRDESAVALDVARTDANRNDSNENYESLIGRRRRLHSEQSSAKSVKERVGFGLVRVQDRLPGQIAARRPRRTERLRRRLRLPVLERLRRNRKAQRLSDERRGPSPPPLTVKDDRRLPKSGGDGSGLVKFLALHIRFDRDIAAYSLCDFGGGEIERKALAAYREIRFPSLANATKDGKGSVADKQRFQGHCPLTPEEMALLLVALGYRRFTPIYLATGGGHIWGDRSRMAVLQSLYPNLVTKEDLLSDEELTPFSDHPSMLAAIDHIVCVAADAFALSDSNNQLASLITGHRIYLGTGREMRRQVSSIRPNWKRFASILTENGTIQWSTFERYVRGMIKWSRRSLIRPITHSIYRHPRTPECMCYTGSDGSGRNWTEMGRKRQPDDYDGAEDDDYELEIAAEQPRDRKSIAQSPNGTVRKHMENGEEDGADDDVEVGDEGTEGQKEEEGHVDLGDGDREEEDDEDDRKRKDDEDDRKRKEDEDDRKRKDAKEQGEEKVDEVWHGDSQL